MSLLNTLLTRKILTEAEDSKYGFSNAVLEPDGDQQNPADPTQSTPMQSPDVMGQQTDQMQPTQTIDDPTSPMDDTNGLGPYSEDELMAQGDMTMDDVTQDTIDEVPLKVLTALSSKRYKLNNLKLYKKYMELSTEVGNYINNVIMVLKPLNKRQSQVISIVHKNLLQMVEDLNTYMSVYGESYENNEISYATYLKRYELAIKAIEEVENDIRKQKDE